MLTLVEKGVLTKKLNSSDFVDFGELSFVVGGLDPFAKNSIPTGSETLKLGAELFCVLSGGCGEFGWEEGLLWLLTEILSLLWIVHVHINQNTYYEWSFTGVYFISLSKNFKISK